MKSSVELSPGSPKAAIPGWTAQREELTDSGVSSVMLALTTSCNFRCSYCPQQRPVPRTMSPEVLDAAIRHLVSSRVLRPRLTLSGGEPLLAMPLVRRALDRVRKWAPEDMSPDVRIITNGARLDGKIVRLLASRDVHITLSFDGVAPAQDDRRPGSFESLDHLLVWLRRSHPKHFRERLAVSATLTPRNVQFLSASFRYFLSRGVCEVDFVPVVPDAAGWNERLARELDRQLAEVVALSVEKFRRSGRVPFRPFRPDPTGLAEAAPGCGCGSHDLLTVDVDGALAPCVAFIPSTFGARPRPLRRVLAALGGLRLSDPGLHGALLRRERRARRLRFLAGLIERQGPRGACARCPARATCFVCPVAIACNGGRVPAFHCDVNYLFARRRTAFLRRTA